MALTDNLAEVFELNEQSTGTRYGAKTGYALAASNAPGYTSGKVSYCATFNGSNQALSKADTGLLLGTTMEIHAWVYMAAKPSGTWSYILTRASSSGVSFQLLYNKSLDRLLFGAGGTYTVVADHLGAVPLNTWLYVVCWFTPDGLGIKVNNGEANFRAVPITPYTGDAVFALGKHYSGYYWNGRIDQVAIWTGRNLSDEERTWLYNDGNGRSYSEYPSYAPPPLPTRHAVVTLGGLPGSFGATSKAIVSAQADLVGRSGSFNMVGDLPDVLVARITMRGMPGTVEATGEALVRSRLPLVGGRGSFNAAGGPVVSAQITMQGRGGIFDLTNADIVPGAVTWLNAVRSSDRKSTVLTWSPAFRASSYRILRSNDMRGTFSQIAETTEIPFTDNHGNDNANYAYSVYAVSASGHRGQSSPPAYSFGVDFARRVTL